MLCKFKAPSNRPSPPLWAFMYCCQLHGFKMRLLGKGFHTLIRNALFPSPTDVRSRNPSPPRGLASSLAHRPMSGSDTICNSPNPPLADIVRPLRIAVQPHSFKTRMLGRSFYTLIKNVSIPSPTDVHHSSTDSRIYLDQEGKKMFKLLVNIILSEKT